MTLPLVKAAAARAFTEDGHVGKAYPLTGAVVLDYATVAVLFSAVLGHLVRYADPAPQVLLVEDNSGDARLVREALRESLVRAELAVVEGAHAALA